MEWIQGKIYTTHENIDAVCAMLLGRGIKGLQIEDTEDMLDFLENNKQQWDYIDETLLKDSSSPAVTFYVPDNNFGKEELLNIKAGVESLKPAINNLELQIKDVDDENWLNNWKKFFKPIELGEKIVIKPVWEQYNNQEKIIFNINPGQVFGTGLHQTTQLCVCALEKTVEKGAKVLDLGCGSGILWIISLMLGADYAFAVDLEPNAVPIAYENAALNNILPQNYEVICGNVLYDEVLRNKILEKKFDIVVANIVADVIIKLSSLAFEVMTEKGVFIASGIIDERLEDVINALQQQNFIVKKVTSQDNWYCLITEKSRD